jgi:hypothetical protein
MMKKLYDEGDEEMKRMIAKSWTVSTDYLVIYYVRLQLLDGRLGCLPL